jgi:hypothetical protein
MTDENKKRLNDLFALGLRFNGQEYVGIDSWNKDFNFHHTEIFFDTDEQWYKKFDSAKKEYERRKALQNGGESESEETQSEQV